MWAHNHYQTKSFSLGNHVFWFPKSCKEHTCKFKQHWFGPYKIKYYLSTLLVIVDKFDPNPILININKLKPYWFKDNIASRGLKSTFERGKDISNTRKGSTLQPWKCTRYRPKTFVFSGWNQNPRVTTWNQSWRFDSCNQNPRQKD
jgi:hypothetical protein